VEELAEHWESDRRFEPSIFQSQAAELREKWHEAVRRSLGWAK